jgi:hypothetical protein
MRSGGTLTTMRVASFLWVAVLVSGCSLFEVRPKAECDDTQFQQPATLSCDAAVDAALESLSSHAPIKAAQFVYGLVRPRCRLPTSGEAGTVIITFGNGSQQSVFVWLDGTRLAVDKPSPYPPTAG